ncbi:MAG: glucosylglycerol hydrolase [Trueperaceae bacterium]
MSKPKLNASATGALVDWAKSVAAQTISDQPESFEIAEGVVKRLGAHVREGVAEFGFWAPEVAEVPSDKVYLELFTPPASFGLEHFHKTNAQSCTFSYARLPVEKTGVFVWCAADNVQIGSKETFGAFYQLAFEDAKGKHIVRDYLAYSTPFGAVAPAELVDMGSLWANRQDKAHFAKLETAADPDGCPRITPPLNILQVHVPTATKEGTLESLTRLYKTLSEKLKRNEALTPFEEAFTAYDAVQLMPIEPTIEHEAGPPFWEITEQNGDKATVRLLAPDITNWGYDTLMSASSATNPAILGTKRPHELLEFIETLHAFPKPIKIIFDIVYGHTDNQAVAILTPEFLAGSGMYGQNMRFRHPVTRATMLEMQRRKSLYGVGGIRVDGAQDFKYWDAGAQELKYDDDYLRLMNDIVLEVAGVRYRPYMIFEDGRPWPRDDWELASTYREVTKLFPNVFQWGPLTFAHNTPFLFTFWLTKWWRIRELAELGSTWITGCANHDTLRRGTQVPTDARINTYLGKTLPEILQNAYDNKAAKLFDYALMPGVPMDFINASVRAPWSFIRNTDDRYGVKVMSEESRFCHWAITEASFNKTQNFARLKALGFQSLESLRRFTEALDNAVKLTHYDLEMMARVLNTMGLEGPTLSASKLKDIARAWMDDLHDYCNLSHYVDGLEPARVRSQRTVREFRGSRPWLRQDFGKQDVLNYLHPSDGSIVFYGLRQSPDNKEQVLFIANMEGAPCTLTPLELHAGLTATNWKLALATNATTAHVDKPLTLNDSEGVVFTRAL